MTSFNKHNVSLFYDNLETLIEKYQFTADRIFNCDETGVTTVQRPEKTIAEKGVKRVGAAVSHEKGTLVTMCATVSAMGTFLPPFCVFPRVNTQPLWEEVLPTGSKAEGHPKASGWMTEDNFLNYLEHFFSYARPSAEFPVLLLLDNHVSHVSLSGIKYCRENNIVLLSFPPHCSHELQPLDKTVFGPFKTFYNQAADTWMKNPLNKAKMMTIHNIPKLISEAFPKAFTPSNIKSGFEATGIEPRNRDRIPEDRYLPAYFTDQPEEPNASPLLTATTSSSLFEDTDPTSPATCSTHSTSRSSTSTKTTEDTDPASSATCSTPSTSRSSTSKKIVSPLEIRPFTKAAPRKKTPSRSKVTSTILTSSPYKRVLEEKAEQSKNKKTKLSKPKSKKSIFHTEPASDDSDSELSNNQMLTLDDDSISDLSEFTQDTDEGELKNPTIQQLDEGDYVLVRFLTKKSEKYFIGKIESTDIDANNADVMFLKRKPTKGGQFLFSFPQTLDAAEISIEDIMCRLNPPTSGGTQRTGDFFTFTSQYLCDFQHPIM